MKDTSQIPPDGKHSKTTKFNFLLEMSPTEKMMTDEELAENMRKFFQLEDAYRVRGMAYKLKGDKQKALDDFESYLNIVPKNYPLVPQIRAEVEQIKKDLGNLR